MFSRIFSSFLLIATPVAAQTLTPEEILAEVDARVAQVNPYQSLLNDPDPERSLAAMQIMLESGDATLVRLATEFGLLSPNPQVQRAALEGMLATQPVLTLRLDGTNAEGNFDYSVESGLEGTVSVDKIGFARLPVGDYSDDTVCHLWRDRNACLFTINVEGVFLNHFNDSIRGLMTLTPDGSLVGTATLRNTDNAVPITISLLD